MYSLHALVDATLGEEDFASLSAALTSAGVRPIRMAGVEGLARLIDRVKVSGVFINWDAPYGHRGARLVRESRSNPNVPITMITGSNATSTIVDAAQEQVTFFLTKPLVKDQLERIIEQQLPYMHDERRSYQRLPLRLPVSCDWGEDQIADGQSINISASGMLLDLTPRPELGTQLRLNFGGEELEQEFELVGEVVRLDPRERLGIRYVWESLGQHERLKDCLDRVLEDETAA